MLKTLRIGIVLMLALMTGAMATNVGAQETGTYILRVGIVLHPAGEITGGQICFENDFGKRCQDLALGAPEGYYEFDNIEGNSGAVFVEGADPYEGSMGVLLNEGINAVDLDLYAADPAPTPAPNLPDTGVGTAREGDSSFFMPAVALIALAGVGVVASGMLRRGGR
ncbi:MAG: hypothetical protein QM753_01800 [Thermomicrobiales bacterium]